MKKMLCGHDFHKYFWIMVEARNDVDVGEQVGDKVVMHHIKKGAKFYLNRPSEGVYNVCFKADYVPDKDSSRAFYLTFPKSEFRKLFKILPTPVRREDTDVLFENMYYEGGVGNEETR